MKLGRLIVSSIPVVPLLVIAMLSSGISVSPSGVISDRGFVLSAASFTTAIAGQLPEIAILPGTLTPSAAAANAAGSVLGAHAIGKSKARSASGRVYALHSNITTTWFYVGEPADGSNGFISNAPSAWDEQWEQHFGGVDNPAGRSFAPKENPYYFALPYNDFDANGNRRSNVSSLIPWARSRTWPSNWSMCKNQWIKITKGGKSVYAQWEDVGPFLEDDSSYVFGGSAPHNIDGSHAGLDVSPTVRNALGLQDVDHTSWQFVDAAAVPAGPWKNKVTASQITWN